MNRFRTTLLMSVFCLLLMAPSVAEASNTLADPRLGWYHNHRRTYNYMLPGNLMTVMAAPAIRARADWHTNTRLALRTQGHRLRSTGVASFEANRPASNWAGAAFACAHSGRRITCPFQDDNGEGVLNFNNERHGHVVYNLAFMSDQFLTNVGMTTPEARDAYRQGVACQELGHIFGLGHRTGDCMAVGYENTGCVSSTNFVGQHSIDMIHEYYIDRPHRRSRDTRGYNNVDCDNQRRSPRLAPSSSWTEDTWCVYNDCYDSDPGDDPTPLTPLDWNPPACNAPANLAVPSIVDRGAHLSTAGGVWDCDPESYTYRWYINGQLVSTSSTAPKAEQCSGARSATAQVYVTAYNEVGTSPAAVSAQYGYYGTGSYAPGTACAANTAPVATQVAPGDYYIAWWTWPTTFTVRHSDAQGHTGTIEIQTCGDPACASVWSTVTIDTGVASGSTGSWSYQFSFGEGWYWRARSRDSQGAVGPWTGTLYVESNECAGGFC